VKLQGYRSDLAKVFPNSASASCTMVLWNGCVVLSPNAGDDPIFHMLKA